jgi:hypothetical protein
MFWVALKASVSSQLAVSSATTLMPGFSLIAFWQPSVR